MLHERFERVVKNEFGFWTYHFTSSPSTFGSRFSSGTSTSSMTISPVTDALKENLPSILGAESPFIPWVETKKRRSGFKRTMLDCPGLNTSTQLSIQCVYVYVVIQFYPECKFSFLLFVSNSLADNVHYHTPKTKGKKILTKDKIEPQHLHHVHVYKLTLVRND